MCAVQRQLLLLHIEGYRFVDFHFTVFHVCDGPVFLDGSERVDEILRSAMLWDVMGGVARRSWARNPHAMETSDAFNESHSEGYHITMPYLADDELIKKTIKEAL